VRNKAANDLHTFTTLQQAISSRAPSRNNLSRSKLTLYKTKSHHTSLTINFLDPVFVKPNSAPSSSEQSTEAVSSQEITTFTPAPEVHVEEQSPVQTTTTTTTTSTTTEKPASSEKFGKQRNRFGVGRGRATTPSDSTSESSSTTEATPRTPVILLSIFFLKCIIQVQ
jgi:hypothetical protein